jgi:hypothetical protein
MTTILLHAGPHPLWSEVYAGAAVLLIVLVSRQSLRTGFFMVRHPRFLG